MIIAIVGPTCVGKTITSIKLAEYYNGIILNYDATQIYKMFDIGSAKIKEMEKENIPHYLIDFKNPNEDYNVYDYQKDARNILNKYKDRNIIMVGGTGLYLNATLYDYTFNDNKNSNNLLYNDVIFIGLKADRDILYSKINDRVDKMFNDGLINEVNNIYQKYPNSRILHSAIGYKEIIPYLNNQINIEDVKELIKKNSRHYAKRQMTWFNNKLNAKWFDIDYNNINKTIDEIINYINKL